MNLVNKLTILVIVIIVSSCTHTTVVHTGNQLAEYNLKGRVATLQTKEFNTVAEKDTFKLGKQRSYTTVEGDYMAFNKQGSILLQREFFNNDSVLTETKYTYTNTNLLKAKKVLENDNHHSRELTFTYTLGVKDSIVKAEVNDQGAINLYVIDRNAEGRKTKEVYTLNNQLYSTTTYAYNAAGGMVKEEKITEDTGIIAYTIVREFNQQNKVVKEQVVFPNYPADNSPSASINITYTYGKVNNNQTVTKVLAYKNGMQATYTYVYNSSEKLIEESVLEDKGNGYFKKDVKKYNEYGDIIYSLFNMEIPNRVYPTSEVTYRYVYDSYNNWIYKIEYHNGTAKFCTQRTITYF